MRNMLVCLLVLLFCLAGCGKETEDVSKEMDLTPRKETLTPEKDNPAENMESRETEQQSEKSSETALPDDEGREAMQSGQEEIWLVWESKVEGEYPMDCTVETMQFAGSEEAEILTINEDLYLWSDNQWRRFLHCKEQGQEQSMKMAETWGDIWAYPITSGQYFNAVTVLRERMYFRTGVEDAWNTVRSFVYDCQQKRLITYEEALEYAHVDQEFIEGEIAAFISENDYGTYDGLSSVDFAMLEDGTPMFMVGALVSSQGTSDSWPEFFTWTDGAVEWTGEHPVPLYLLDEAQDMLACQRGMAQFSEEDLPTEEEAMNLLGEIAEVQEYLAGGMSMMTDGSTEWIGMEQCLCIALGTDQGDHFVREIYYAVSEYSVYRMNPLTGEWESVGFG